MPTLSKKIIQILGVLILTVITVSGIYTTMYMTQKIEDDERSSLLLRAQMIATMLDTNDLTKLSGSEADLSTPEYIKTKATLERVRVLNTDSRFVYIMGQNNDKQFFYVDAEPMDSQDFSPPGQIYTEASQEDIQNFASITPYTKGPYTDRWGTWFTAYAPIISSDGQIRNIGMDIQAEKLLLRIQIVRDATIIIFSLLFLSALSVFVLLYNNSKK